MKSRRKAREAVLQALYQCDSCGEWSQGSLDLFFQVFIDPDISANDQSLKENLSFAHSLADGVVEYLDFIDQQITRASTHWHIGRMSRVDRNILRLSAYEIGFVDDIPPSVSINEAIEIAKRFGADDSPMFINGVLDKIARVFRTQPDLVNEARASDSKKAVANA